MTNQHQCNLTEKDLGNSLTELWTPEFTNKLAWGIRFKNGYERQ